MALAASAADTLAAYLAELSPHPAPADRARRVAAAVRAASPRLAAPRFEALAPADLWLLFDAYDRACFGGHLAHSLGPDPRQRLTMRLSTRMTSAGGKLEVRPAAAGPRCELVISTRLLFENFAPGEAPPRVNGLPCPTRLDALQRIFEHELVHLVEVLAWGRTSCRRPRFRALARALFGHTEVTHRLTTPRQRVLRDHGVRPGDRVRFSFEGRELEGFVNRVTVRATVLVPDRRGRRYSDGGRYAKYYVPVGELRRR